LDRTQRQAAGREISLHLRGEAKQLGPTGQLLAFALAPPPCEGGKREPSLRPSLSGRLLSPSKTQAASER
jgi:hypothetical protein